MSAFGVFKYHPLPQLLITVLPIFHTKNSWHSKILKKESLVGLDNHHDTCWAKLLNGRVCSKVPTLVQTAVTDIYSGKQVQGQERNPHGCCLSRTDA